MPSPGLRLPCWNRVGVPPGSRTSYQRATASPPSSTVWVAHSDWWVPMLRYWSCIIRRKLSESSPGPCLAAAIAPLYRLNGAIGTLMGPVRVELAGVTKSASNSIDIQAVRCGDLGEVVGRAGWRRRAAQVAGQEAAAGAVETQVEVHFLQRTAGQQRGLVDAPQAHAKAVAHGLEHIGRHVVAVRPHAQLGIVVEVVAGEGAGVGLEGVEVPAAGHRVAGLRDGDALVVGTGVEVEPGEIGDDPAVYRGIVQARPGRRRCWYRTACRPGR